MYVYIESVYITLVLLPIFEALDIFLSKNLFIFLRTCNDFLFQFHAITNTALESYIALKGIMGRHNVELT